MTKLCQGNDVVEFVFTPTAAQPFIKTGRTPAPLEQVYPGVAIHVTVVSPVICYAATRYSNIGEGFLVIPVSSLGKEYVVSAYPQYTAVGSGSQIVSVTTISAVYDETIVFFEMGGTLQSETSGGLKPGKISQVFNLTHKGDVLCFSSNGDLQDISGSRIVASKPVAVVSGNQCATVPAGTVSCNFTAEMELPTFTWGKEYLVTPIYGRKKNPIIRIYAKEKNTTVYRDGQQWLVIPRSSRILDSGYVERRSWDGDPRAVVIHADKPIYVVMYNSGQTDDNVTSDPFQMVLSPLEQYQNNIAWCTPGAITSNNNFKSHYANLVYQLTPDGSIPDDLEFAIAANGKFQWKKLSARFGGTPGLIFSVPVSGQKYACKQLVLPGDNMYRIRAKTPLAAYAYGFGTNDAYGMPATVGLKNLGVVDTVKPRPTWTVKCDGSTEGRVTDYPDDDYSRSNLGLIYMDLDSSKNYEFSYDSAKTIVYGDTRTTDWSLKVIDQSKDARAFVVFSDRSGNDSTVLVEYKTPKLVMFPENTYNFGLLKKGETKAIKIILNNTSTSPYTITHLGFKKNNQGFKIQLPSLPLVLPAGSSYDINIEFMNTKDSVYIDQIGVGDDCTLYYKTILQAQVTSPVIIVNDLDFGKRPVDTTANMRELRISNMGPLDLVLTGDDHLSSLAGTPFEKTDWPLKYPFTIQPYAYYAFPIGFAPTKAGEFSAKTTFSSDASTSDSVAVLKGVAVEPGLIATSYDWKSKQINPTVPYPGTIELQNNGSQPITIQTVSGTDPNFLYDKSDFIGLTLQSVEKKTFTVEFKPLKIGPHELTINFITNTPGISASSQLTGIGTITDLTAEEQNDETAIVGKLIPQPIHDNATLEVTMPSSQKVTISIFNMLGQKIATIVEGMMLEKGVHTFPIATSGYSNGNYSIEIRPASGDAVIQKMTVVR